VPVTLRQEQSIVLAGTRPEESAAARGARWITCAFLLIGVLNYAYGLMQTRLLDVTAYSAFAAGQSLILWASAVASVSIPWVLVQGVARARSRAEQDTAVRFAMVASVGSGAVTAVVVGVIALRFARPATALVIAIATMVIFLSMVTTGYLQGRQRMRTLSFLYVGENLVKNVAGLLLVLAAGLRDAGALAAFGLGGIVMLARWPPLPHGTARHWLAAAADRGLWHRIGRITLVEWMVSLFAVADVVLVAVLPGVSHDRAASYQASVTLSRVPLFIAGAILTAFFPALSRSATRGPMAARAVRMYAAAALPVAIVLATMPPAVLGVLFPAQYGSMATLLRFTAVTGLAAGGVILITAFFQAADDYSCVPWLAIGIAGYVAALLAGWRLDGVTGLAAGSAAGALVTLALLRYRLGRREGRGPRTRIPIAELIVTAALLVLLRPYPVVWLALAAVAGLRTGLRFLRSETQAPDEAAPPPGCSDDDMTIRRVVISSFDSPGNPHYSGGGAAVVEQIARWLARDYDVTVVTASRRGGTVVRGGVRYRQLPLAWAGPRGGQLLFHSVLPMAARRIPHDLWIESFTPPFSTSFLPVFSRAPVVGLAQNLSGEEMWQRYRLPFFLVERLGLRCYRDVVTLNRADSLRVRRCSPAARIRVIPNWTEVAWREREPGPGAHILFLGRIDVQEKGLDLLLAAYRRSGLTVPLVLAGGGTRREEARLGALLDRTGGRVVRAGHVGGPDRQRLLDHSTFVVLPSRHEAFGLAALEGMACAKPVLHFDLPALRWMDGDLRVPCFDVDALAAGMQALAGDENMRHRLGRAAYAAACRYQPAAAADRYRTLVREVLSADRPGETG
jgi:glycosyltransferase involved in cell wall biosynthesis/O-antigen/teichoic acid export membrane protein